MIRFTIAYTFLFLYVIASIVFWGYSLNKQNKLIFKLEKEKIDLRAKTENNLKYHEELARIKESKIRRAKQYMGEGSTFILIILLTACIVYYAYYRQRSLAKLQQNFMLSVTHELKTPIAGIKLNMQTLERRTLDEARQKKLLESSVTEANRLNDLCNNILAATQLESTEKALYTEMIDLAQLIRDAAAELQSRYPGIQVVQDVMEGPVELRADRNMWKLVLSNLLENARKYSPAGHPITIMLKQDAQHLKLQVCDQGPGIPDDEKEKIFGKFYRIGNENTRSYKGTGLGLYIVRKIVSLYKYDIAVKNNQPSGAIFEVRVSRNRV